jgi:hypothetical protein
MLCDRQQWWFHLHSVTAVASFSSSAARVHHEGKLNFVFPWLFGFGIVLLVSFVVAWVFVSCIYLQVIVVFSLF